jgi:hypothetical protein
MVTSIILYISEYEKYTIWLSIYFLRASIMDLKSINEVLKFGFCSLSVTFIAIIIIITFHDYLTGGGGTAQIEKICAIYGHLPSPKCW